MRNSSSLENCITELIAMSISNDLGSQPTTMESMDTLLDQLVTESQAEAERCVQHDFECKARIYLYMSKAMLEAAELVRDKDNDISKVLEINSESWSTYANTILSSAVADKMARAYKYEQAGNFEKYIQYKNEAKLLEYEFRAGLLRNRLERQVTNFVKHKIEDIKNNSGLQDKKKEINELINNYSSKLNLEPGLASEANSKSKHIADQIKVKNDSRPSSKGEYLYDWTVYLYNENEDHLQDLLKNVDSVRYTLHKSFPKPIIEFGPDKRSDRFKLEATGWGEFEIKVDVQLNTGDMFTKYHWLNLTERTNFLKP
jgi:YEATS family